MSTIAEVKESFETELQALFALDQLLAEERSTLKREAFVAGRPLSPEEVIRRKEIAATRGELGEAMEALALDTVNALENASDVDALLSRINMVNQQLADDLERLKQMEEKVARVEAIAKGMDGVIDKLLGFRTSLT